MSRSGPPPSPPPKKPDPEPTSFFESEEWPVWRDKIARNLVAAWVLNYDLRRLPPVLRKVRGGKRLTRREATCLSASAMGLSYFVGMSVARGLVAGHEAVELEALYRERLQRRKGEPR